MEIIALRAKLDPDELRQYLRSQIASVATDTPEETASAVPVTVEVDWGRVLDNFGPEGVAALLEQLGSRACSRRAALTGRVERLASRSLPRD